MSDVAKQNQQSLWYSVLPEISKTLKEEWRWVVGYALIGFVLQFALASIGGHDGNAGGLSFASIYAAAKSSGPKALSQLLKNTSQASPPNVGTVLLTLPLAIVQIIFSLVAYYGFTVVYLRKLVKSSPLPFSTKSFFFWLGQQVKAGLYLVGMAILYMVGIIIISTVIIFIGRMLGAPKNISALFSLVFLLVSFVFIIRLSFTVFLVSPLAVLEKKPVLTNSKILTKGNYWRIFQGIFLFWVFMLLGGLIIFAVTLGMQSLSIPILSDFFVSLLNSLYGSVILMANVVYCCNACRILTKERKTALSSAPPPSDPLSATV